MKKHEHNHFFVMSCGAGQTESGSISESASCWKKVIPDSETKELWLLESEEMESLKTKTGPGPTEGSLREEYLTTKRVSVNE